MTPEILAKYMAVGVLAIAALMMCYSVFIKD